MSNRPPETEYSALQALLQIRTNSSADGSNRSIGTSRENPSTGMDSGSASDAGTNNHNDIVNLIRMSGTPASLLQHAQMGLSSAQISALASIHQSPGSALYPSSALQSPSFSASTLQSPFQRAPLAAAPGPMSPSVHLPGSPALSPLQPSLHGMQAVNGVFIAPHTNHGTTEEEPSEKKIRKDEVEAALRSKPQRGRKRENLNAEERLELTRTRNREHAKSTRIRKKARYQELLDVEQKFLEITNSQQMESKRRQSIVGFVEARATMLMNTLKRIKEHSASSSTSTDTDEERKGNENRSISFDHSETFKADGKADGSDSAKLKDDGSTNNVKDFIADEDCFRFETSMFATSDGADSMTFFDEIFARRIERFLGCHSIPFQLQYRITGSTGGIAFNAVGSAFAKVDLMLTSGDKPDDEARVLLSSLVSLAFAEHSHCIQSVAWSVLKDAMPTSRSASGNESKSDSTAKESLESQIVYPSVVSFDEAQREKARDRLLDSSHTERQQADDHMDDPGMSI